jgi:hypothetical protein
VLRKILRILGIAGAAGTAAAADLDWPVLPAQGFISGRPASQADVNNGGAIFVASMGDKIIGKPIGMQIPQYARLKDTGARAIVVQAEEANGMKLFGVRTLDGKEMVTTDSDLELLGTQKPN